MTGITATRVAVAALVLCGAVSGWAQTLTTVSGTPRTGYPPAALRSDGGSSERSGTEHSGTVDEWQTKDDLLDGLDRIGANAKERNEVNLDKNMMALAHRGDLSSKMDMITVRNYEFASRGMYSASDLDALKHKLQGPGWSHLVRNESDGETNDIVVKTGADGLISDMVILNIEPREINVVHLKGHFKMEDVNGAMGSAMGMGGGMFGMAGAMGHMGGGSSAYSSSSSRSFTRMARTPSTPATPATPATPPTPPTPAPPAPMPK